MKSIISTTYDDKYLYFLPIVTWLWSKLGVDVVCFLPNIEGRSVNTSVKLLLATEFATEQYTKTNLHLHYFDAPEHKQATYAQCSRLYGACLDLPIDEVLITSDIDMAVFQTPNHGSSFTVNGIDLVPKGQVPICYISGEVKEWRRKFAVAGRSYQQCLDDLLGDIECDNMRGNYWAKDQEEAYNKILGRPESHAVLLPRSNGQNQFATRRYDRDDSFILDRLNPDTIDYHMNRPGYEDDNFEIILQILSYHYPAEDFTWLINYTNEYKKLL